MLLFPIGHWGGGRGVNFGNLDHPNDTNRLSRPSRIPGLAGGKKGTFAFNFKLKEDSPAATRIGIYSWLNVGSDNAGIKDQSNGVFLANILGQNHRIFCRFDSDFDVVTDLVGFFASRSSFPEKNIWRSVLISWDLAAGIVRLWVDDVDEFDAVDSLMTDREAWYQGVDNVFAVITKRGAVGPPFSYFDNRHFPGCFEMFYFNVNSFIDFGVEANRRKFFNGNGIPVDLGSDGTGPGLGQPLVYFAGPPDSFGVNKGSGGVFVHQGGGSLTTCS